jgi:hypothetical protein
MAAPTADCWGQLTAVPKVVRSADKMVESKVAPQAAYSAAPKETTKVAPRVGHWGETKAASMV